MEAVTIPLLTELINGVGFPIAVCIALFWSNHKNSENQAKILREYKDVLQQNTHALNRLADKVTENGKK